MTARQRLGEQDHIGFDVPVFDREEPPGASHSRLYFVGDHQRAVFTAERCCTREKLIGGHIDAFALDRLDNKGGNLARRKCLFQRGQIIERYRCASGQQRLETAAEVRIVGERKRAIGQSVERMGAVHDARPAGRAACEFRIRKKDLVQMGHVFQQTFGQYARQRGNVELHEIGQVAIEDALQRLTQCRMVPANRKNAKTAQ